MKKTIKSNLFAKLLQKHVNTETHEINTVSFKKEAKEFGLKRTDNQSYLQYFRKKGILKYEPSGKTNVLGKYFLVNTVVTHDSEKENPFPILFLNKIEKKIFSKNILGIKTKTEKNCEERFAFDHLGLSSEEKEVWNELENKLFQYNFLKDSGIGKAGKIYSINSDRFLYYLDNTEKIVEVLDIKKTIATILDNFSSLKTLDEEKSKIITEIENLGKERDLLDKREFILKETLSELEKSEDLIKTKIPSGLGKNLSLDFLQNIKEEEVITFLKIFVK